MYYDKKYKQKKLRYIRESRSYIFVNFYILLKYKIVIKNIEMINK